jgi:hypothetical protein
VINDCHGWQRPATNQGRLISLKRCRTADLCRDESPNESPNRKEFTVMSNVAARELEIDHSELFAITEEILDRFPYDRILATVEKVREYAELHELYPEVDAYAEELVEIVSLLARSAETQADSDLADRLKECVDGVA